MTDPTRTSPSRRTFLATTAVTAAATLAPAVHAAGNDTLKIGLIGAGGRGRGAVSDALKADPNTKLVAICDIFPDFRDGAHKDLKKNFKDRVDVTEDRLYTGFNGYKELIDNGGCDIVFLTTPPGFRPMHLAYAVEKGKHVFAEKPMAVDPVGVRSVIESAKKAKEKNLLCASGYCYRHELAKKETVKRVHDGMIGDVVNIQTCYNTGRIWYREVPKEWDEMKVQLRNWYYYSWLSGDFIVEQHCHSLDKAMWVLGNELPVAVSGLAGRQVRTDPKFGNVYDHFSTVFEYASGRRVFSYCRQIDNCDMDVSDTVYGTKGVAKLMSHAVTPHAWSKWSYPADNEDPSMYVQEHKDFFASLRAGTPFNDMEMAAQSTMMGIMGREAGYTGKRLLWKDMVASNLSLAPKSYEWGPNPVPPVATPGSHKSV